MYDTTKFWHERVNFANDDTTKILPFLSDVKETKTRQGDFLFFGRVGDYKVNVSRDGVLFKGSLSKYFLPSNLYTMTRQSTSSAIEKLSDCVHLHMDKAKVTRIDISTVIPTRHEPKEYFKYLGEKARFERLQASQNTLYYNTQKKQLIFYDKTKEAIKKGSVIPSTFINQNLFRYELRYLNRLTQQLNGVITGSKLYDESFYYAIVQNWKNEFETISKINDMNAINYEKIKTPKDVNDVLVKLFILENGQSRIDSLLKDLKQNNVFDDPRYYSRVKNNLRQLIKADKEQKHEMVKELETKVKSFARYAR